MCDPEKKNTVEDSKDGIACNRCNLHVYIPETSRDPILIAAYDLNNKYSAIKDFIAL